MIRSGFASHADGSAVFLHDAARDPESKTRANVFFRRKERLEKIALVFGPDAATGISHSYSDAWDVSVLPTVPLMDPDVKCSTRRHRIHRVTDQVGKCLANLARQRNQFGAFVVFPNHSDVSGFQSALIEREQIVNGFWHIEASRRRRIAVKAQGLARNMRNTVQFTSR